MQSVNPKIEDSWKEVLSSEFSKPYFLGLKNFLMEEKKRFRIYPSGVTIFNAFNTTAFNRIKIVILGQDPYHGLGQAHGLCFSVPEGVNMPPSLINIFREISSDIGTKIPESGDLTRWAKQGVLLLNATLTVRAGQPGSHQGKGWEQFTDAVIQKISLCNDGIVFLLWGRFAQQKISLIDESKHLVLRAAHPSPYSAENGFFGCRHFSKANHYLSERGISEIQW